MLIAKKIIGTIGYLGGLMAMPEEFTWSWGQMIQYSTEFLCSPGEIIHYVRSKTSYHAAARNALSTSCLGDWLLMLDTDQSFEPDLAVRLVSLMRQNDLDVLTGLYHYKVPPHLPVLYWWNEKAEEFNVIGKWRAEAELLEISCCGAGCLLVRYRVFERIRKELGENPFDPIHPWSEDFSFFRRLQRLGIKTYCAPKVESYHLLTIPLSSIDCRLDGLNLHAVEQAARPDLDVEVACATT